jgi:hypothetical protein
MASSDELVVLLYFPKIDKHTKDEREKSALHSAVCYVLQCFVHLVLIYQCAEIQPYFHAYPGNLDE